MNKTIIFGVLSFAAGAITGVLTSKKYFEKRSDLEIEDIKNYYHQQLDYLGIITAKKYDLSDDDDEINPEKPDISDSQEKIQKNHETTTNYINYTEMYRQKAMEDPNDQSEEEFKDQYEGNESEAANEEYAQNRGRRPRIISYEEASNLSAHVGNETLFYYTYSESLVDEHNEEIDEPGLLLGDCLEKFDFIHSDERIIFIMNYDLDVCYEVQKIESEWNPDE